MQHMPLAMTPPLAVTAAASPDVRVGVIATSLNTPHLRGMGKYLGELCRQSRPEHRLELKLLAQDASKPMHAPVAPWISTDLFDWRGDRFFLWEQIGVPSRAARHGLQVLHYAENSVAWWQPTPTVVTIHDTLPWESDYETALQRLYWYHLQPRALLRADAVITISQSSARDIVARWPQLESRLSVIPHGIDTAYFDAATAPLPTGLAQRLGGRRYAVYLGGAMPRKRFTWAVETLAAQPDPDLVLVACGFGAAARQPAIDALPPTIQNRVLMADFLSDAELHALYRGAVAMLYPTLYEGFGFPAIEAQAAGVPAIFSPLGSLDELVGPLAMTVPAQDLQAWAAALTQACRMPDAQRRELAQKATAWAQRFRWSTSFEHHLEVYRRVASGAAGRTQPQGLA